MLFKCASLNLRNRDPKPWRSIGKDKILKHKFISLRLRCQEGDKMVIFKHNDGEIFRETRKLVVFAEMSL